MQKRQHIRAYLWLFFLFCTLGGGHYLLFRFSFHPLNSLPITRGVAFGSALWSTVLLVALVLHKGWARYVLIVWLVLAMFAFSLSALIINTRSVEPLPGPNKNVILGVALYGLALVPLGASRSLRRFLAPRTAGGH